MTGVKICGLSSERDIGFANELRPDYIGFVFARSSRRYLPFDRAACLKKSLAPEIRAVGVFVDEAPRTVLSLVENGTLDLIQLHGGEDEAYIRGLRRHTDKPIIRAFQVKSRADIEAARGSLADFVLLDSGGGSGTPFDWSLVSGLPRPFFLAGGLSPLNVAAAISACAPFAVDVSSGVETDGVKDFLKMKAFIEAARKTGGNK